MNQKKKLGMITLDVLERTIAGGGAKTIWPKFPYKILFRKAQGVTFRRLRLHDDRALLPDMLKTGQELIEAGADALVGGCGFMGLFQRDFVRNFSVPCLMSPLCMIPLAELMIGPLDKIGILTADADAIDRRFLEAMGADLQVSFAVQGLKEKTHFNEVVFQLGPVIDTDRFRQEIMESAQELVETEPAVKVIICECTMLAVYREAIRKASGRPVFDWELMLDWLYRSISF